jgi:SPP1 gp7 family putative phage head morphogenesis protein
MSLILDNHILKDKLIKLVIDKKSESQWRAMTSNAYPYIVNARKKIYGFFEQQLDECLAYLNKKAIEDEILDWDEWTIRFDEFGQLLLTDIIGDWGPEILNQLIIGISFDIDLPYVQEFIKDHSYRMAVNVNETTKNQLRNLFAQATIDGDSVPQIEKKLRAMFTDVGKIRANMIARSEVIRAHNAGAEASYLQSGVVNYKQWWASKGERRTCVFCNAMHGKIIPVGATYFQQGDRFTITDSEGKIQTLKLDYDDIRYPPFHVRCRCALIPVRN